ncbi:MAG: histidinol-phosphatase HisJ family protein [Syntrophomonadaceae bacterium]|nr:histidinol-phosphatase HisJ family protein [Syntrophomonadaceae bacterium]
MLLDYHVHAVAHGEYQYNCPWIRKFIETARSRQLSEIGFTEHDEYAAKIDYRLLETLRQEYDDITIKIGLEVDYWEGREKQIQQLLSSYPYDYIIGSIHYLDGWAFDHPDYRDGFEQKDIDQVYKRYFQLLGRMVDSGLFTIVGHFDLIKKWGHRPIGHRLNYYYDEVLNKIKKSDLCVELNSAGLRKPVGELYPGPEVLKVMASMKIPITLASDAHHPSEVGEGVREAAQAAWAAGYREIASWSRGKRVMVPLFF